MSMKAKAKAKAEEARGRMKESAGRRGAGGRRSAEGRAEKTKGILRQVAEKIKDVPKR